MLMLENKNGFTLIELIMVIIILVILATIAIPRYKGSVKKAEEAVEDAIIFSINEGLENYALNKLVSTGRAYWPNNPFDVLETKPSGYDAADEDNADTDGEWTYNSSAKRITHQRQDNTRYYWTYDAGTNVENSTVTLPPFNPPWNDGNSTNWNDWCNFELNEGCYACENMEGAGMYCLEQCAESGCPGFSITNDDNNNTGNGIGVRTLF